MNKDDALKRAQDLIDYYGSGKYKEMSMSTNARDTHFAGFARLLAQELYENGLLDLNHAEVYGAPELVVEIIAERVYDLFVHDRMHTRLRFLRSAESRVEAEEYVNGIPDMTAWPAE